MDFGFSEEQNMLRDQVNRFMKERCPMDKVRPVSYTHLTLPTICSV